MTSDSAGVTAYWMAQDGSVSEDLAGRFVGRPDNLYQSAATPVLLGPSPLYYDAAERRWLPVGRESVSPDGSRYAYAAPFTTAVQVVTVATGQERSYAVPRGPWHVLDFTPDGVYLNQQLEGVGIGLWRLDLRTNQLRQVLSDPTVTSVSNETAWVWDVDPSARASYSALAGANMPNRLSRLDLRSGALTHWVTTADAVPNVIGFGRPSRTSQASGLAAQTVCIVTTPPAFTEWRRAARPRTRSIAASNLGRGTGLLGPQDLPPGRSRHDPLQGSWENPREYDQGRQPELEKRRP